MKRGIFTALVVLGLGFAFFLPSPGDQPQLTSASENDPLEMQRLQQLALRDGSVRVIVELRLPAGVHIPEGYLRSQAAISAQRQDIASTRAQVLSRLSRTTHRVVHR